VAIVIKCDNPNCTAHYEVSSFLGGHTFTCNHCGSRVTIRDLCHIGSQPQNIKPTLHLRRVKTPMLDKILAEQEGFPIIRQVLTFAADHWVMILFVMVFGCLLVMGNR
jgi:hypothetical protein